MQRLSRSKLGDGLGPVASWGQSNGVRISRPLLDYRASSVPSPLLPLPCAMDALGNRASQVFAPNGWLSAGQDELGYLTSFIRDAAGQQICVVDANNGRSTTTFSVRGLTLATQDQLGALTSFTQGANTSGKREQETEQCNSLAERRLYQDVILVSV